MNRLQATFLSLLLASCAARPSHYEAASGALPECRAEAYQAVAALGPRPQVVYGPNRTVVRPPAYDLNGAIAQGPPPIDPAAIADIGVAYQEGRDRRAREDLERGVFESTLQACVARSALK